MFNFPNKKKEETCCHKNFLGKIKKLRDQPKNILAAIAIQNFDHSVKTINDAYETKEIKVDNMFEANVIALRSLLSGEHFQGVSAIINPDHWEHDPYLQEYKQLNYEQAANGVIIERLFILQNQKEINMMRQIMNEQASNGIHVMMVMEDDIKHISAFPDFTILPDTGHVLYVPNLNKLLQCHITQNVEIVKEASKDFKRLKQKATKWEIN